jgi:hypothetical protein
MTILEAALLLAVAPDQTPAEVLGTFATTVARVVAAWSATGNLYRPTIERLCDDVVTLRARPFWQLLMLLRAM